MNVLFHTTTAVGIAVLISNTEELKKKNFQAILPTAFWAFVIGVISHGALDYIPHCYPIPSKIDMPVGLLMILVLTYLTKPRYRIITGMAFIGCIFPDLVDLLPAMLNKQLGWSLPVIEKVFPWHYPKYSGSLYTSECGVSNFNHLLVVLIVAAVCYFRRVDLMGLFGRSVYRFS